MFKAYLRSGTLCKLTLFFRTPDPLPTQAPGFIKHVVMGRMSDIKSFSGPWYYNGFSLEMSSSQNLLSESLFKCMIVFFFFTSALNALKAMFKMSRNILHTKKWKNWPWVHVSMLNAWLKTFNGFFFYMYQPSSASSSFELRCIWVGTRKDLVLHFLFLHSLIR